MSQEETLAAKYAQYSDEQIVHIICNPTHYTESALAIAQLESKKRKLPKAIFENFAKRQAKELKITIELALVELSMLEKALVYFLWMFKFLFAIFMHDAHKSGYELKTSQLSYYFFGGMISTILAFVFANYFDSFLMFIISIVSGFLILLNLDEKFNRRIILEKYSISE